MGAGDLLDQAIEELYSVDPDEFMQRRTALAKQARSSDDDGKAAKDIAGLRKPTRSAYALNQLVRSDPEAAPRLAELGDALRAAQDALDGARMRELSTLRRGLIEELADQAFQVIGQPSPAPGLREEVVSTLNAAVADQSVVEQLGSATLLRPARWDGFGFASPPELSVVRQTTPRQRAAASTAAKPGSGKAPTTQTTTTAAQPRRSGKPGTAGTPTKATRAGTSQATQAQRRAAQAAARAQAKAEAKAEDQRRRQALAEAARAVKEADSALAKAVRAEEEQQTRVRHLHEQLTDSRRRLDEMRIDLRRAENRQRKAQQALDRQQR